MRANKGEGEKKKEEKKKKKEWERGRYKLRNWALEYLSRWGWKFNEKMIIYQFITALFHISFFKILVTNLAVYNPGMLLENGEPSEETRSGSLTFRTFHHIWESLMEQQVEVS